MPLRIPVPPALLEWAMDRTNADPDDLVNAFPALPEWLSGDVKPTVKQLERFAKRTHTPFGFFFLSEPPEESLPLPDFRTMAGVELPRPSPDLLETIDVCERRQGWYRQYLLENGAEPLSFVGAVTVAASPVAAGTAIRETLGFGLVQRQGFTTWTEALFGLIEAAERVGILVMVNGVVGNNTSRKLDPREFRGFAIADPIAPLVFLNGADTKAAQIFTLAHEIAHVWIGQSAVSKPDLRATQESEVEAWCNAAAAELLVPLESFRPTLGDDLVQDLERLARQYRVSTLVILRRLYDAGRLTRDRFSEEYERELARVLELAERAGTGGQFYYTQPYRVSRRFARALIGQTHEGRTLYRDAMRLLGLRKVETFEKLGEYLGAA